GWSWAPACAAAGRRDRRTRQSIRARPVLDQRDRPRLARLEADRRACRDVEVLSGRAGAVEVERSVRLVEGVVATHLDRAVASARDLERRARAPGVELDLAG